jgi:hypothetical protein
MRAGPAVSFILVLQAHRLDLRDELIVGPASDPLHVALAHTARDGEALDKREEKRNHERRGEQDRELKALREVKVAGAGHDGDRPVADCRGMLLMRVLVRVLVDHGRGGCCRGRDPLSAHLSGAGGRRRRGLWRRAWAPLATLSVLEGGIKDRETATVSV